jgi:hypothetical protein
VQYRGAKTFHNFVKQSGVDDLLDQPPEEETMTDQTILERTGAGNHSLDATSLSAIQADQPARSVYQGIIDEICGLSWDLLDRDDLTNVASVYYYFSVQFRENLEIACSLFPEDELLQELDQGERNTDNLSPWPGVADARERMNHDEFMRRTLLLDPINAGRIRRLKAIGTAYLAEVRGTDLMTRATSLASYEDGGLEKVFEAILKAKDWDGPLLGAFKHFLVEHIKFDSDPEHGHGAICRHLAPDDAIMPLWSAFREMLVTAVPKLTHKSDKAAQTS